MLFTRNSPNIVANLGLIICQRNATQMTQQRREFYMWINVMFNRKDNKRVKEIGPDRSAAEWIVRNGGSIKFAGYEKYIQDYNALPTGAAVSKYVGLKNLKVFDMNSCSYITNLSLLKEVSGTLEYLDIGNCESLADISPLAELKVLKKLILTQTLGKNRDHAIDSIKRQLPNCEVVT